MKNINRENTNGFFEYKMSVEMMQNYLKMRKGKDKSADPQEYLCKIINEEFGVKGKCIKVLTF